jgi:hypothetical protein
MTELAEKNSSPFRLAHGKYKEFIPMTLEQKRSPCYNFSAILLR